MMHTYGSGVLYIELGSTVHVLINYLYAFQCTHSTFSCSEFRI